jgi:predicted nuclease of predicted toxin-antitoxin system
MARLYADEDFPGPVVLVLRAFGHDVVTVQQAGRRGTSDSQVLADATADGRAVLTHNSSPLQTSSPQAVARRHHFVHARQG